jgi:hypothetical protein
MMLRITQCAGKSGLEPLHQIISPRINAASGFEFFPV